LNALNKSHNDWVARGWVQRQTHRNVVAR
jgi:hypothetical protein